MFLHVEVVIKFLFVGVSDVLVYCRCFILMSTHTKGFQMLIKHLINAMNTKQEQPLLPIEKITNKTLWLFFQQ